MKARILIAAAIGLLPVTAVSAVTAPSKPTPEPERQEFVAPLPNIAGTTWTFHDDSGATFTVTFEPKGGTIGTMFSPLWRWNQDGSNVVLEYANKLGGQTTREGQLVSRTEMNGVGRSSRGMSWSWSAQRIR